MVAENLKQLVKTACENGFISPEESFKLRIKAREFGVSDTVLLKMIRREIEKSTINNFYKFENNNDTLDMNATIKKDKKLELMVNHRISRRKEALLNELGKNQISLSQPDLEEISKKKKNAFYLIRTNFILSFIVLFAILFSILFGISRQQSKAVKDAKILDIVAFSKMEIKGIVNGDAKTIVLDDFKQKENKISFNYSVDGTKENQNKYGEIQLISYKQGSVDFETLGSGKIFWNGYNYVLVSYPDSEFSWNFNSK